MRRSSLVLVISSVAALCAVLLLDFQARIGVGQQKRALPDAAVVFTGQFDRIELALSFFDQRQVDQVFISGVNAGAGINPLHFATQFDVSPAVVAGLRSGRIVLAPDAETTFENAVETACWLAHHPDISAIILITGRLQMPRASLALERALPQRVDVLRISPIVPDQAPEFPVTEIAKFVATWGVTLMPVYLWPVDTPNTCS